MKEIANIYTFYTSSLVRIIRLSLFLLLVLVLFAQMHQEVGLRIGLFLSSLFLLIEVFVRFYIARQKPTVLVAQNTTGDLFSSITLAAACSLTSSQAKFLQHLLDQIAVQELLGKLSVEPTELIASEQITKGQILTKAAELVAQVQGDYITTVDLMVAYLLLIESQSKLLLTKKIQLTDVVTILLWIRQQYPQEEHPKPMRVRFWGEGIGDSWVTGWTIETQKYTRNYTYLVAKKEPLLVGRAEQFAALIEGLQKKGNNNVLLVGDTGIGKESIVQAFACQSYGGELPPKVNHKHVLELLVNAFLAGASSQGELEERLQLIIEEVSHAKNVILFIPEFQNIIGGSSYGLDISGVLLPYLQKGDLPIIATMSLGNYKAHLQNSPLKDTFDVIQVPIPDENVATQMLLAKANELEQTFPVLVSYEAAVAAVQYANRYRPDDILPGGAVMLLEDVVNASKPDKKHKKILITPEMVVEKVEAVTHTKVGTPGGVEASLLLHLEDYLHKQVIGQEEAITSIAEALRRIRAKVAASNRPASFLFLGPTGVGKTETAKALSDIYFKGQMIRLDMSEYAGVEGKMRLLGTPNGERGEITEKIHDNPFSLVLLDEFEKASSEVLNLFLQILEDGRLTDNRGQTVSFANAIIIATSNAGSEFIRERMQVGTQVNFQQELIDTLQAEGIFKPELLNRFDAVIAFRPLTSGEIEQVVTLLLAQTQKRLKDQAITVTFSEDVKKIIARKGFDQQFGARPLRRFIETNIEDMLAKEILAGHINRGDTVTITGSQTGEIVIVK